MKASILIISKNRKLDLRFTLSRLNLLISKNEHEVLVLLDGCDDNSETLIDEFSWVNWTVLNESIGASAAREKLYKNAVGKIFIGFDDDAHPLQNNFIQIAEEEFKKDCTIGVLAFQEIKGIYKNDLEALASKSKKELHYFCNEFVGCGFAIKRESYNETRGFPLWVDIYGEESCVSLEVLSKKAGNNYFRFEKQLKNTLFYYLVYYKYPTIKIIKLLSHNFFKYALKDFIFFKSFFKSITQVIFKLPVVVKYRKPVRNEVIVLKDKLPSPILH